MVFVSSLATPHLLLLTCASSVSPHTGGEAEGDAFFVIRLHLLLFACGKDVFIKRVLCVILLLWSPPTTTNTHHPSHTHTHTYTHTSPASQPSRPAQVLNRQEHKGSKNNAMPLFRATHSPDCSCCALCQDAILKSGRI